MKNEFPPGTKNHSCNCRVTIAGSNLLRRQSKSLCPANTPVGVAASTTDLIVTEYCGQNVDTIDCQGHVALLATLSGVSDCRRVYVTIAPSQSANARFTPRDIFVTQGSAL